jgi:hypothetical protein
MAVDRDSLNICVSLQNDMTEQELRYSQDIKTKKTRGIQEI